MNIVYSSEHYAVLAYPSQHGYELVDKENKRSLFIQGDVADRFQHSINQVVRESHSDEDEIDEFLDAYCADSARPISFH